MSGWMRLRPIRAIRWVRPSAPSSPRATVSCLPSVSETGWPYVQHLGPAGVPQSAGRPHPRLRRFPWARQYVSVGNLTGNDRVSLILLGIIPHQRRLKLIGHARQADDPETLAMLEEGRLEDAAYAARVERGIVIAPRIARKSGRRFFDKAMRH